MSTEVNENTARFWRGAYSDYDRIEVLQFVPPQYKVARMIVRKAGVQVAYITFAISPSSLNESRQNNVQMSKTNGGWFLQRLGPAPTNLSFDGYMLDIEGYLEKHQFLNNWKLFLEDTKTDSMEYQNDYTISFMCSGREYFGIMTAISISTSSLKPFLHQYNGTFVSLSDNYIYKPDDPKVQMSLTGSAAPGQTLPASKQIYQILSKK